MSLGPSKWAKKRLGPSRYLSFCGLLGLRLFGIKTFFDIFKGLGLRNFKGCPPFNFEFPSQMLGKWRRHKIVGGKVPTNNQMDYKLRTKRK